jgi:uncharacterized membrane protein YbhN (UPF0104 family)
MLATNGYSSAMLSRLRASAWARGLLLAIVLAFCAYGLYDEWPAVSAGLAKLHWYSVAFSLAGAVAGAGGMMMAWRAVLADLGSPLPVLVAARVTFVSQLGKYVPGAVWSFAAHVELGHEYQVPRRRGAASVLIALAVAAGTGLLAAAVILTLAEPSAAWRYWLLLAVPLIAVCLYPTVMHRLLNIALRILRQEPLERPITWRGLGIAAAWSLLAWLLLSFQLWFLLTDVTSPSARTWLIGFGAYALACTLGLLVVIAPNGIGAREVVLVAALAPILPSSEALAVALVARVVTTFSDLAWGAFGLALKRHARVGLSTGPEDQPVTVPVAPRLTRSGGKHRKPVRGLASSSSGPPATP